MRKKWRLQSGSETFVIVRRADLFPEEAETYDHARVAAHLDAWLGDPPARAVLIEIDETIHGRSWTALKQADRDALRRSVKKRLADALKSRTLVAVRAPRSFLTQAPLEQAAEAAPPPAAAAPPRENRPKTWIEFELRDEVGEVMPRQLYRIVLPDGSTEEDFTDAAGRARLNNIDPGVCQISFPDLRPNTPHRA